MSQIPGPFQTESAPAIFSPSLDSTQGDDSNVEVNIKSKTTMSGSLSKTSKSNNQSDKPSQPRLTWRNITFKVPDSGNDRSVKDRNDKCSTILQDCYGQLTPGEVSAIVGPSGAGKSTLMNLLSGRVSWAKNGCALTGTVKYGEKVIFDRRICSESKSTANSNSKNDSECQAELRRLVGYVMQDDALLPRQTLRETLEFHAWLRLHNPTKQFVKKRVDEVLKALGLWDRQHVFAGDATLKGASGGERKRLSVGIELLSRPQVIFLDEPTSGLDSFSAFQVGKLLKEIAKTENMIVCCSIHQPSSEIFELFDQVVCIQKGRVFLKGYINKEGMRAYGGLRGQLCGKSDYKCESDTDHESDHNHANGDDHDHDIDEDAHLSLEQSLLKRKHKADCLPCLLRPQDERLLEELSALPLFLRQIAQKPCPDGANLCSWILHLAQSLNDEECEELALQTARLHELIWDVHGSPDGRRLVTNCEFTGQRNSINHVVTLTAARTGSTDETYSSNSAFGGGNNEMNNTAVESDSPKLALGHLVNKSDPIGIKSSVNLDRKCYENEASRLVRLRSNVEQIRKEMTSATKLNDKSKRKSTKNSKNVIWQGRLNLNLRDSGNSGSTKALFASTNSLSLICFGAQISMLISREFREKRRSPMAIFMRILIPFLQITMLCLAYINTGRELKEFKRFLSQESLNKGESENLITEEHMSTKIREHWGKADDMPCLTYIQAGTLAVLGFYAERTVFLREYFAGTYSVFSYIFAKFVVEFCILTVQIIPAVIAPYFLLGCSAPWIMYYGITLLAALAGSSLGNVVASCAPARPERVVQLAPLLLSTVTQLFIGNFRSPKDIWPPLAHFGFLLSETRTGPMIAKYEIADAGIYGWFEEKCNKPDEGLLDFSQHVYPMIQKLPGPDGIDKAKSLLNSFCSALTVDKQSNGISNRIQHGSQEFLKGQCACFALASHTFVEQRYSDYATNDQTMWMLTQVLLIILGYRILGWALLRRNSQTML